MRALFTAVAVAGLLLATPAEAQTRSFSANSIILPMDENWQTADAGILAAYGIVYRLLERGITVYSIVNPAKTSFTDTDFSITNNSGAPVARYNWTTYATSTTGLPTPTISYLGGPFVVDAADYAAVMNYFKTDAVFAAGTLFRTAPVNVHVAQQTFTAPVALTLRQAPPHLAVFAVGSAFTGMPHQYLADAGLAFGGTYGGAHGAVYDDFTSCADITSDGLINGNYTILWMDAWTGDGCTGGKTVDQVMSGVDRFLDKGGGFAAGADAIATAEGSPNGSFMMTPSGASVSFGNIPNNNQSPFTGSVFSNPYAQYGDIDFSLGNSQYLYWTLPGGHSYKAGVQELFEIFRHPWDVETYFHKDNLNYKGPIFYFSSSKHDNPGRDPSGERLFLNTLMYMGADIVPAPPPELARSSPIETSAGLTYQGTYQNVTPNNAYPPVAGHLREYIAGAITKTNVTTFDAINSNWDAADGIPAAGSRTVFTVATVSGSLAKVAFTAANVAMLQGPLGLASGPATTAINGIRAGGLGGIDHSTPAIVGPSTVAGSATRPTVAFAGGLDGMLHCIGISGTGVTPGQEVWAFIPPSQLGRIASYQAGVDGAPQVSDVFIDPTNSGIYSWRTVVAVTNGLFGGTVDMLDVTDPLNPKWLWTGAAGSGAYVMGAASGAAFGMITGTTGPRSVLYVDTTNAGNGGNGFNLYALDAGTGAVVWQWNRLYSRKIPATNTTVPNDLPPPPALANRAGDGTLDDRVIVGDNDGKVWALDAAVGGAPGSPLFDAGADGYPIAGGISLYRDQNTNHLAVATATGGRDWVPAGITMFVVGIDVQLASQLWKTSLAAGEHSYGAPTISGNDVYLVTSFGALSGNISASASDAGNIRRLNLSSGSVTLTAAVTKGDSEIAVGAGGNIISASAGGEATNVNAGNDTTGSAISFNFRPFTIQAWLNLGAK